MERELPGVEKDGGNCLGWKKMGGNCPGWRKDRKGIVRGR